MKKLASDFVVALACVAAAPACAVPIHATFDGTVSGSTATSLTTVLNDVPVGTTASFDVFFDDEGLIPAAPITDLDLAPVSGTLRLGSLTYVLDAGFIWSYVYQNDPSASIISYGLQLTGSGPGLSGGSSLFGLFLNLAPDLTLRTTTVPRVGFAYPFPGGESYSYADLAGTFRATRGTPVSVPEPSALLLMLPALLLIACSRRTVRGSRGTCSIGR